MKQVFTSSILLFSENELGKWHWFIAYSITNWTIDNGNSVIGSSSPSSLSLRYAIANTLKPVIEYLDGWKEDVSKVRNWDDLPQAAKDYVEYIEKRIGCFIKYVSVVNNLMK